MSAESPLQASQSDRNISTTDPPKLRVDFSWKKFQAWITSPESPSGSEPVYIADLKALSLKAPRITFTSASTLTSTSPNDPTAKGADVVVIGRATLHNFSIHADYELHGRPGKLKALKRWNAEYTHLSHAFSSNEDGSPVVMTWASESGFTEWDFVCLDERKMPVAKFTSKVWALKKIGEVEFVGEKAMSVAARDEIIVTGLTLYYCMLWRTGNIWAFFASMFQDVGPLEGKAGGHGDGVEDGEKKGERSSPQGTTNVA